MASRIYTFEFLKENKGDSIIKPFTHTKKCITKDEINEYFSIEPNSLDGYAPKQLISDVDVTFTIPKNNTNPISGSGRAYNGIMFFVSDNTVWIPFTNRTGAGGTWTSTTEFKVEETNTINIHHNVIADIMFYGETYYGEISTASEYTDSLTVFINGVERTTIRYNSSDDYNVVPGDTISFGYRITGNPVGTPMWNISDVKIKSGNVTISSI